VCDLNIAPALKLLSCAGVVVTQCHHALVHYLRNANTATQADNTNTSRKTCVETVRLSIIWCCNFSELLLLQRIMLIQPVPLLAEALWALPS